MVSPRYKPIIRLPIARPKSIFGKVSHWWRGKSDSRQISTVRMSDDGNLGPPAATSSSAVDVVSYGVRD